MKINQGILPYIAPSSLIIGCLILKGLGINSVVDTILLGAAAFVFGFTIAKAQPRGPEGPNGKTSSSP
ncbi:hypothetical protein ES705_24806 [subsurface metagenome]